MRFQRFFAMRIATREVEIAGISARVNGSWRLQVARDLTDAHDGFLRGAKCLDPLFTSELRDLLEGSGVTCKKLPARSPNLNSHAERFVRTARETLSQHIFFGERHLRYVLTETMKHCHAERHHQGLGGKLIRPAVANDNVNLDGRIECRERLGGLLQFSWRSTARSRGSSSRTLRPRSPPPPAGVRGDTRAHDGARRPGRAGRIGT